jgi:hypothetical protein
MKKSSKKRIAALKGPGVTKIRFRAPYARTVTEVDVPLPIPASGLKDSGVRAASVTGGLREPSDGIARGRFDLIPTECLAKIMLVRPEDDRNLGTSVEWLDDWLRDPSGLGAAKFARTILERAGSLGKGLERLAIHYGRGAAKYADRNWEKGLETARTVDSMFRHFAQYLAGDQAEDHLAAVVWNCVALMWFVPRIADGRLPKALDTYGLVRVA